MKKILAILLATVMCVSLVACDGNKKALELSESAFINIHQANKKLDIISNDILTAWKLGIYNKSDITKWGKGFDYFVSNLSLDREDIIVAMSSIHYGKTDEFHIDLTKKYYDTVFNGIEGIVGSTDTFSACIDLVVESYRQNGMLAEIELLLSSASESIKELSKNHSDYEHYENVKKYFTAANTSFNFCSNPSGTFEQAMENINDYNNTADECYNSLFYFFEE